MSTTGWARRAVGNGIRGDRSGSHQNIEEMVRVFGFTFGEMGNDNRNFNTRCHNINYIVIKSLKLLCTLKVGVSSRGHYEKSSDSLSQSTRSLVGK